MMARFNLGLTWNRRHYDKRKFLSAHWKFDSNVAVRTTERHYFAEMRRQVKLGFTLR